MEAMCFCGTLVSLYPTTRYRTQHLNQMSAVTDIKRGSNNAEVRVYIYRKL
jgi:hypothetical protein